MADKPTNPFAGLDKALLRSTKPTPPLRESPQLPDKPEANDDTVTPRHHDTTVSIMQPRHHDTTVSIMQPRHHDTTVSIMQPRHHDTTIPQADDDIFDVVRKAVKQIGKEAATHRFTLDENNLLANIEYTYKRNGIRTSENEITRIA